MKRCCFMFFELRPGVRGLGVLFFLVNLVLVFPVINGWVRLLSPVPHAVSPPAPAHSLLQLYQRHRPALLALASAALAAGLLVNLLLVYGIGKHRRQLLLPWLVWYGALFAAASAAVLAAVVLSVRGRLRLPLPGVLINVGLLPLYWYWFFAVAFLYADFGEPPPPRAKRRRAGAAARPLATAAAAGDGDGGGEPDPPAAANGANGAAQGGGGMQLMLGQAIWYWAAINAAVLDAERLREETPTPTPPPPRRSRSRRSLGSLRGLLRRLSLSVDNDDEPPLPLAEQGGRGAYVLQTDEA